MANKKKKNSAKENERMRKERIAGSDNGRTMRTRVVKDKKKYTRKTKHKEFTQEDADECVRKIFKTLKM
jgi:hypothetical protein